MLTGNHKFSVVSGEHRNGTFPKIFSKIYQQNMPNKKHIDSNALLLDLYSEIALLIISG